MTGGIWDGEDLLVTAARMIRNESSSTAQACALIDIAQSLRTIVKHQTPSVATGFDDSALQDALDDIEKLKRKSNLTHDYQSEIGWGSDYLDDNGA